MQQIVCGNYQYDLVREVPAGELAGILGCAESISAEELAIAFHRQFQMLDHLAPHEMSPEQGDRWEAILALVDYEGYMRMFPLPEFLNGTVMRNEEATVTVRWLDEAAYRDEEFPIGQVPARLVVASPGETVRAKLVRSARDGILWSNCLVHIPVPGEDIDKAVGTIAGVPVLKVIQA